MYSEESRSNGKALQRKKNINQKSTYDLLDNNSSNSEEGPIKRFQGATTSSKKGEGKRSGGILGGNKMKKLDGAKK